MKLRFIILILFLVVTVQPVLPQQSGLPLTKEQVMDLVNFGMSDADLAKKIHDSGIDFEPTEDYIEALRKAGAHEGVLRALRKVNPKPLTREQVGKLVAGGVASQRAATLVKQRGIGFRADERYLKTLRLAGADETLVRALRQASEAVTSGTVRENPNDGLQYVWIPPGTFMMGCSPGDNHCLPNEKPSHWVTLSKGFWVGRTEATVGAYKRFTKATGRQIASSPSFNKGWTSENMPIVKVSWYDAHDYCTWTGGRLPTEAEWEYAARGGSAGSRYGDLDEIAWYDKNSEEQTQAVAQKRANGFGLYDFLGNVFEWVNDWYNGNYYLNSPSRDPVGPANGQERVFRGLCWGNSIEEVRVSYRDRDSPDSPASINFGLGFRCVWEVAAP